MNHSLTLFNCKTLGRLPEKSEPLYPHLQKRNDNPYFIRIVVKTKLAACEVFRKVHNLHEMTIDGCSPLHTFVSLAGSGILTWPNL